MSYSRNSGGTCYEKLSQLDTHQVQIFRRQIMSNFSSRGTRKHTRKSSTCTKGSRVRPTSRVYSDADPGLVCPTAAAAAAAADDFFLLEIMNPNVTDT